MDGQAWGKLGEAYREREQYELAAERLQRRPLVSSRASPSSGGASRWREPSGARRREALEAARHAARLSPEQPAALVNLGRQLLRSGCPHEAIAVLQDAVRRDPTWAMARGLLGPGALRVRAVRRRRGGAGGVAADHPRSTGALGPARRLPRRGRPLARPPFTPSRRPSSTRLTTAGPGVGWARPTTTRGQHEGAMAAFDRAVELGFSPAGLWEHFGKTRVRCSARSSGSSGPAASCAG